MDSRFQIIGSVPRTSEAEAAQFGRIIPILRDAALSQDEWGILVLSVPYRHTPGSLIENDQTWAGEIDVLLLATNRIVVYELKGYTVELRYAPTNSRDWKIKRANGSRSMHVRSTFLQASKQRAYLLRDFLEDFRERHGLGAEPHFVVDARVVYKAGSDLSGFFYAIPRTEDPDMFDEKVTSKIVDDEDRQFVRWCYAWKEQGKGKHMLRRLLRVDFERLKMIYAANGIQGRTADWFSPLTESQIPQDYATTGSDRFELTRELAEEMAHDLLSSPGGA